MRWASEPVRLTKTQSDALPAHYSPDTANSTNHFRTKENGHAEGRKKKRKKGRLGGALLEPALAQCVCANSYDEHPCKRTVGLPRSAWGVLTSPRHALSIRKMGQPGDRKLTQHY